MDFSKYADLPDSLTTEETRAAFKELMAIPQPKNYEDAVALAEAMYEVADRQWHTYELLDSATRNEVDEWVIHHWDHDSLEVVRPLISVIAHLGLVKSAEMLRREVRVLMPGAVRDKIQGALREFGTTVDDPYSGMRNLGQSGSLSPSHQRHLDPLIVGELRARLRNGQSVTVAIRFLINRLHLSSNSRLIVLDYFRTASGIPLGEAKALGAWNFFTDGTWDDKTIDDYFAPMIAKCLNA